MLAAYCWHIDTRDVAVRHDRRGRLRDTPIIRSIGRGLLEMRARETAATAYTGDQTPFDAAKPNAPANGGTAGGRSNRVAALGARRRGLDHKRANRRSDREDDYYDEPVLNFIFSPRLRKPLPVGRLELYSAT